MQLKSFIALGVAVAAIAAPLAQATDSCSRYGLGSFTSGTTVRPPASYAAAQAKPEPRTPRVGDGFSLGVPNLATLGKAQLPGAGATQPPVAAVLHPVSGFDWADAGIGGGFVVGLLAILAGAAIGLRRTAAHGH
jgi:hypothetical protein